MPQDDTTPSAAIASGAIGSGAWTVQIAGVDCRNYKWILYTVTCTIKSAATKLKVKVLWASSLAGTYGEQQAEGAPSSGVVTANDWEEDIDISGKTVTFVVHWPVPVGGAFAKIEIESDAGTPTVSVDYMRKGV